MWQKNEEACATSRELERIKGVKLESILSKFQVPSSLPSALCGNPICVAVIITTGMRPGRGGRRPIKPPRLPDMNGSLSRLHHRPEGKVGRLSLPFLSLPRLHYHCLASPVSERESDRRA